MRRLSRGRVTIALVSLGLIVTSLVFVPAAGAAEIEENVTRNHDADWHHLLTDCGGVETGSLTFEPGPVGAPPDGPNESAEPPRGTGSLHFSVGPNGDSLVETRNTRFEGKLLSDLVELSYWTFVSSSVPDMGGDLPAVFITLELDTTGDGRGDETLVFDPRIQEGQGDVTPGVWQRWFAHGEGALWHPRNAPSNQRSLSLWATQFPTARIAGFATTPGGVTAAGGVILAAGCDHPMWAAFNGYSDALTIRFNGDVNWSTFDMDPPSPNEPRRLDCDPETASNPTGTFHTITCVVRNDQGVLLEDVRVHSEATGANDPDNADSPSSPDFGDTCVTDEDGRCSFTHGGITRPTTNAGRTTYRIWIDRDNQSLTAEADPTEGRNEDIDEGSRPEDGDNPDDTDVVEKNWAASQLQCEPETAMVQTGAAHNIVCSARDANGTGVAGATIDMEAAGANNPDGNTTLTSPDFSCVTGSDGNCPPMVHGPGGRGTTISTGVTSYRAWIDADNSNATPEADTTEGRDEAALRGTRVEPDNTDVMEATWSSTGATQSPTPTLQPCPSDSPTPTTSPTSTTSPSPTGSPSPCLTPSPTPTRTATPTTSPTDEPVGSPVLRGPCAGYFPDTRQPDTDGEGEIVVGTSGADQINGSSGGDVICGLGGDDAIRGFGGHDLIVGNGGDDIIRAGRGSDSGSGNRGNDTLRGGGGKDILRGGGGSDTLLGNRASDRLQGGGAADLLRGGRGPDLLIGGKGRDACAPERRGRLRSCEVRP